jgi:hypothetical protein
MAVIANTFTTYDAKGIREDLTDAIYDISPEDTPFMNSIGRGKATQKFHEWQTDALDAPVSNNQQLEGDDITSFPAVTPTVRLGNYLNISRKLVVISDTEEVVDKAGRDSEMAYQLAKRSAELKRDMETAMLANIGANAGAVGTARVTGSLLAFLKTNTNFGATGADPVYTNIPTGTRTDGTQRPFTETILKDVISQCWTEGATPRLVMVGAFNKQASSAFQGIATQTYNLNSAKKSVIVGAADVYVSDFGKLTIVPNRFQRARDALVIDPEFASIVYLRKFTTKKLAKTGDAEKRMLVVEWGLKVHNEKAHGIAADLNTA